MRIYNLLLNILEKIRKNENQVQTIASQMYPVGSIYISVNDTSPSTLFGGTWEKLDRTFLFASGSQYAVGDTGGTASETLTTNQIPAHTHGSKTLSGTFYAYAWQYGGGSGIVTKTSTYEPINIGAPSGDRIGHQTYTVTATHTHDSIGGGQAHNNMPPYLVVNMWKRIS